VVPAKNICDFSGMVMMGGDVRILAEFPDRAPVVLSGLAEDDVRRIALGASGAHPAALWQPGEPPRSMTPGKGVQRCAV
jgi:hypothetical protein